MRIGIEAQRLFRPKKHGMDVVALELIRALQILDRENEYFIFVRPDQDNKCILPSQNFKIIEINSPNYAVWEQFYLPLYAHRLKLDVLHCTANTAPLFCTIPVVLTLHDVIFMEQSFQKTGATAYQHYGNLYRKWIVPQVVKRVAQITTVSHYEKQQILSKLPIASAKVRVVHNGVSAHFGNRQDARQIQFIKQRYKLPNQFLFFLGNTDPKKNLSNVLEAFAKFAQKVHDVTLVIADLSEQVVENQLKKLNYPQLISRVQCIGYVPAAALPTVYSLATVFLYPSLRESFGLPILEAMAAGTAVVTSNTAAMPEIAGEAAFMVDPQNPNDICNGILEAYFNEECCTEKIELGHRRVAAFSWQNMALKMLEIYSLKTVMV